MTQLYDEEFHYMEYYINTNFLRGLSRFRLDSDAIMDENIIHFHRKLPGSEGITDPVMHRKILEEYE